MKAILLATVMAVVGCGGAAVEAPSCAEGVGCWAGQECRDGTDDDACGYGGNACVRCGEGYHCTPVEVGGIVTARLCR